MMVFQKNGLIVKKAAKIKRTDIKISKSRVKAQATTWKLYIIGFYGIMKYSM